MLVLLSNLADTSSDFVSPLLQLGALGTVCAYFIFKDWSRAKTDRQDRISDQQAHEKTHESYTKSIDKFTEAIENFRDFMIRIETKLDTKGGSKDE